MNMYMILFFFIENFNYSTNRSEPTQHRQRTTCWRVNLNFFFYYCTYTVNFLLALNNKSNQIAWHGVQRENLLYFSNNVINKNLNIKVTTWSLFLLLYYDYFITSTSRRNFKKRKKTKMWIAVKAESTINKSFSETKI
jgi:hypothetical protein